MNLKKSALLSCVALLVGALTTADAQTPAPAAAPAASLTFSPAFVTQYMFRGVRLGGPSFQPTLEYGSGNLTLGIWASQPLKDKVDGVSDPEIDPYASYTFTIDDSLSFAVGATLYTYPRADIGAGFYRSSFEPNLALNYTVSGVKLTPKLYYDTILRGATWELNAAYSIPVKELDSEVALSATVGTYQWKDVARDASPAVKNVGDYYLIGAAMPFALDKQSKLTVGVSYTKGSSNYYKAGSLPKYENTAAVGRVFGTLTYSYSF
ncbi:MAG: hypothetical protein HZA31_09235 [Opitutae bacterium]|nr:hypothetical protein [Opitutae bacterium]